MVRTSYAILSGEPHEPRDWERFRALFVPAAVIRPVRRLPDSRAALETFGVEEYIASRTAILTEHAFYEMETSQREVQFGHLAHILSGYASRRGRDDAPFATGINSVQLFNDGMRWRIISVAWDADD